MTERLGDPSAHAEMIALTAATSAVGGKYLNDCTLYVTVEPCPMCAGALNWAQLGALVYGADDPSAAAPCSAPPCCIPRPKSARGVLADDCSALVSEFFRSRR